MNLLHLKNVPIFEQLQIEEALLRLDTRNICLINEGSTPAIVMGISGKPNELVDLKKLSATSIPLIKRFSGGGTVIVDEDTVFVSFICQRDFHPFSPYPEPIMRWTEALYKQVFDLPDFHLRENDYVIKERKCGGNAQYLRKDRWLHHTTFLWDYKKEHMDLLLQPKKKPTYRADREHGEFLTPLRDHLPSRSHFVSQLKSVLAKEYPFEEITLEEVSHLLNEHHRQSVEEIVLLRN